MDSHKIHKSSALISNRRCLWMQQSLYSAAVVGMWSCVQALLVDPPWRETQSDGSEGSEGRLEGSKGLSRGSESKAMKERKERKESKGSSASGRSFASRRKQSSMPKAIFEAKAFDDFPFISCELATLSLVCDRRFCHRQFAFLKKMILISIAIINLPMKREFSPNSVPLNQPLKVSQTVSQ